MRPKIETITSQEGSKFRHYMYLVEEPIVLILGITMYICTSGVYM